ncbi:lipid droplet-associated protein [Nocardia sp. NEAU-G5]|uniref:Lipid droplet-associated protein n=1 Tax=Nocardia albiluteola TaxID=2842303 RepID=A0ABS6AZC9_9NOCA|nr:lipid droplet-associated protein [Nocardia albiluteola]MBU3063233.1 lipid droplet-associated protein [Nocardia albiluteola]
MFRPPFIARVAAGAAVFALEEARRLPATAMHLPITAISQLLQTTMHAQQFVTSLALKGDEVFDQLVNRAQEQPEWATFDEDEDVEPRFEDGRESATLSRFDLYVAPEPEPAEWEPAPAAAATEFEATTAGSDQSATAATESPAPESTTAAKASTNGHTPPGTVTEPEVAARYDYLNMTLAQLRARLRMLSVTDLNALLDYERRTRDRAAFVTMLTNRIATVQAK